MYDARPERGTKRICLHCEAKFYDMMRTPILCPKCGEEFIEVVRPPPTPRQPRRSAFGKDRAAPLPQPAEPEEGILDRDDEEREEEDEVEIDEDEAEAEADEPDDAHGAEE